MENNSPEHLRSQIRGLQKKLQRVEEDLAKVRMERVEKNKKIQEMERMILDLRGKLQLQNGGPPSTLPS